MMQPEGFASTDESKVCKLQSIDGPQKLAHLRLIYGCEPFRLHHIHLLIQLIIQENCSDIHLSEFIVQVCSQSKHNPNGLEYCHRKKYLIIVNTIMLTISLGNQMGFIGLHLPICALLPFEDPFAPNGFYPLRRINQCPHTVDFYGLHFGFHGLQPFLRVGPLQCIHIGDRVLIVLIELDGIPVVDQETEVSVRLTWYSTRSP